MKKCYIPVVSILDEYGNRVEVIDGIACSNKKREMQQVRKELEKNIKDGKYDKYVNFANNETLSADIEVRNDDTWELLWIE